MLEEEVVPYMIIDQHRKDKTLQQSVAPGGAINLFSTLVYYNGRPADS